MKIKFVKWQTISVSKIQLVVYYHCCVLIGWATTRLVAKSTGFENQTMTAESRFAS